MKTWEQQAQEAHERAFAAAAAAPAAGALAWDGLDAAAECAAALRVVDALHGLSVRQADAVLGWARAFIARAAGIDAMQVRRLVEPELARAAAQELPAAPSR